MATQAERDYIIQQATARNPSNPQLALWQYAQSIGYSPAQIDEYMGWSPGTSQNWAQSSGLMGSQSAPAAFDPTGMTPVYGVESQGEGEASTRPIEGYSKTVGDKTFVYDTQGNFQSGYRNAGNGWTAPINAQGVDTAPASNTSRPGNVFGDLNPDTVAALGGLAIGGALAAGAGATTPALSGTVAGAANPMAIDAATAAATGGTAGGLLPAAAATGAAATGAGATSGLLAGATGSNLVPGLLTTAGGIVSGNAAADAARTQADAQIRAAQIAADAAKFKPVGVTTNFGSSQFGYDANGNLTSAGYQLAPGLQAAIGQLGGQAQGLLNQAGQSQSATAPMATAAQRAMTLGQGYLATDPQAQAQKYLNDQLGLLAPSRAADMAALQAQMQAQGRGGFAIGGGVGGQGAANPQLQALLNAQLQQNNQLAADATRGGMDYAKFGAGMVGTGGDLLTSMYGTQNASYQPLNTALGTANTIEGMGQNALTLGMDMGNTVTAANRGSAGLLASGMTNAANTQATANAYSPWGALLSGAGQATQGYKFDPMTGVRL